METRSPVAVIAALIVAWFARIFTFEFVPEAVIAEETVAVLVALSKISPPFEVLVRPAPVVIEPA